MTEELKEQIKELLKESLTIEIDRGQDYGSTGIKVKLRLDNEVISESYQWWED